MPRQARYYHDWTSNRGWRYRLWIQPANDAETTFAASLGEPAFAADPGVGSVYIRMPEDVIANADLEGDVAYPDELPIGFPSAPLLKARLNLKPLVTAGLTDLVDYLLHPTITDEGRIQIGAAEWQAVDVANVFCLLTDQGAGGTPGAVLFQGVQTPQASHTISLRHVNNEAMLEVKCVDIIRASLEMVTPQIFARRLFYEEGTSGYPGNASRSAGNAIEYMYVSGSTVYLRTRQRLREDVTVGEDGGGTTHENTYDRARLWSINELMNALRGCATDAYRSLLRPHSSQATDIDFTTDTVSLDTYQNASPFSPLTFYKQGTTTANSVGAEVGTAVSHGDNLYFIGAVWDSHDSDADGDPPGTYAEYEDVMTDGFLSDKATQGLYRFPTAYDFLRAWSMSCYNRVLLTHSAWYWEVKFSALWDGAFNATVLTRTDIGKEGDGVDVEVEIAGGAITQARASIPAASGEDHTEATYRRLGIRPDDEFGFEGVFTNTPTIGDSANFFALLLDDSSPEWARVIDDSSYALVGIGSTGYNIAGIYYLESSGGWLTEEVPVLVHPSVDVPGLTGTRSYAISGTLPIIDMPDDYYEFIDDPSGMWWNRMKSRIEETQRASGLPYTVARSCVEDFSSAEQARYPVTFDLPMGMPDTIGTRYQFTDDDEVTPIDGSIFLASGQSWLDLPGKPFATKITLSIANGTSKVHLLAPLS